MQRVSLMQSPETFNPALYTSGKAQLLTRRLAADLDTPVGLYLKLCAAQPYSFLFESVEGGQTRGRYSFLGWNPDVVWRVTDGKAYLNDTPQSLPPLESLRALWAESRFDVPPGLPPMASGLFGYLGYSAVRWLEPSIPDANPDPLGIHDAVMIRPRMLAIYDTIQDTLLLATPVYPEKNISVDAAHTAALARLDAAAQRLAEPLNNAAHALQPQPATTATANLDSAGFKSIIAKAKDYIKAGDIFQVVLSRRFTQGYTPPPFQFYRALRRLNPSPFLFFLQFPGYAISGSSPEILVRVRDGVVTLRPLAGTRPRGADAAADLALEHELLNDAKERAEHLMLLDLGRNDVGRVAAPGTVTAPAQFVIERYSHVMHISSTVEGKLHPEKDALDAILAGFPAGTVSGAPKIRACQIIDELEPVRRSFYGGAIGYLGATGEADTCIALRTALLSKGTLTIQAGAGIVLDSDPEAELQETENKARALLKAAV
jgi:anthranilate synthase component 1